MYTNHTTYTEIFCIVYSGLLFFELCFTHHVRRYFIV
jgi:hypothetical protein